MHLATLIPAFLHTKMVDLVPTNSLSCASARNHTDLEHLPKLGGGATTSAWLLRRDPTLYAPWKPIMARPTSTTSLPPPPEDLGRAMKPKMTGYADAPQRLLATTKERALQEVGAMRSPKTADAGPLWHLCAPCPPPPSPLTFLSPSLHLFFYDPWAIFVQFLCSRHCASPPCWPTCAFPVALAATLLKNEVVAGTELARACYLLQGFSIDTFSLSGVKRSPTPSRRRPPPPCHGSPRRGKHWNSLASWGQLTQS